jgi:glycosyltransferase involved in cell wall biosynthesis
MNAATTSNAPAGAAPAKRIALVAPSLAGVLRDRANLVRALTARGDEVLIMAPSQLAGEIAALHGLGGEHRNFDPNPPGLSLLAGRRLLRSLRDLLAAWRPDTVLVSGRGLASVAAAAARKGGARRIITIIGDLGSESAAERVRRAAAYRRAAKLSDAIVCHNSADAKVMAAAASLPSTKAPVVTPGDGVDTHVFQPAPWPEDQPGGEIVFLMIADPDQGAAIRAYAAAARDLVERGLPVRFLLATDREAAQDTALLTGAGLEFLGRASEPAALLAKCHVAVHLSADDGSPTALKQAMACGRPVLTLDVPGCREWVDERVNGVLVPADDAAALASALASFVTHRDLLPSEGRASRVKAERALACDRVLEPTLAALDG